MSLRVYYFPKNAVLHGKTAQLRNITGSWKTVNVRQPMSIGKICAIHPDLFRQSIHFPKVASHRTVLTLAYHKREFLLMIQLLLGYSLVTCLYQTSSNRRYHQGCVVPTGQHHPVVQIQQTIDSILPQTCSCACSSTNFLSNPAF